MADRELLDLYFDESGGFTETGGGRTAQDFASQLVGLWAPRAPTPITAAGAEAVLEAAFKDIWEPLPTVVHASELKKDGNYQRLVLAVLKQLAARGWQPIRLVNAEAVHFGDRATNYTNVVAELLVRLFEARRRAGAREVSVALIPAGVWLHQDKRLLTGEEYLRRIREYLAFLSVRRGAAAATRGWHLERFTFGSGKNDRPLQICDLLSHASKGGFENCSPETKLALARAFGEYDFTMTVRAGLESVDALLEVGSIGVALQLVAEQWLSADSVDRALQDRHGRALEALAALDGVARALQLTTLIGWLDLVVDVERNAGRAIAIAGWLVGQVEEPLRARLAQRPEPGLDAFQYAVRRRALTACNHQGRALDARRELEALERLERSLLGRWDLVHEVVGGRLAASVHRTDCLEFDQAASECRRLDTYYGDLIELFGSSLGAPATNGRAVSDLRGKAIGTWLQAEIVGGGGRRPERLAELRALSDRARAEFTARADVARQEQYRSFLEATAGETGEARRWLASSLDAPEAVEHAQLATTISGRQGHAQGFALLHWARIGAALSHDGSAPERAAFHEALRRSGLDRSAWVTDDGASYPAHGVRRYLAVAHAGEGQRDEALTTLGRLRLLRPLGQGHIVLAVIQTAGVLEVAGLLWPRDPRAARRLLEERDADRPGALQLLEQLERALPDMPLRTRLTGWRAAVARLLQGEDAGAPAILRELGRSAWW